MSPGEPIKDKSHFNWQAADLCLRNNLYAPSVHCSYYSCIQYMLYILYDKLKLTEQTFLEQKSLLKIGSHACAIKLIGIDLIKRKREDYVTFQKLVPELKELREKSDYKSVAIRQDEGQMAMAKSDAIKNLLHANYR
jgi:uncharacterized protein (UPF0332 family)